MMSHEWTRMHTNKAAEIIRVHSCSFVARIVFKSPEGEIP
jgi:hypothetical protein